MNIFVLGSSGQIGAPLTSYLRSSGHVVTEFDIVNAYDQDASNPNNKVPMPAAPLLPCGENLLGVG